ncbi:helix-turn-helix domain-containing protein [Hungatella hathewayi]|uniref:helix-turn-helix domain-containing protein n=1 Tax=Hungatella hathewayi TaxID=154046 RepID=UPI001C0262F0|nr:helix-turn-helix transcriptional regulator [Hungatella hathewayi]MBT9798556.1 helix-turn-helix domain-containing protein [Hungatella hathewayi]
MNVSLTIQEKLKDLRVSRGLNLEQLAEQTGISRSALGQYETEDYKDISHTSIITLAKFYGVSTDYLLGITENKNHPNTDLSGLHLSDGMIELLKSGKINTRLLCELAAHRDFVKLMADIEIYVDGIAAMQIQSLNSAVDLARVEIVGRYCPGENDRIIKTLGAAHINEDRYFSDIVHGDIDEIIKDIREAHKGDSTSAPELSAAVQLKKALADAENFKGSTQEKQIAALLGQLGIDYNRLSPEEMRVLMKAFGKSKHLKSPGSKRGKKRK